MEVSLSTLVPAAAVRLQGLHRLAPLAWLALSGCLLDATRGPDLGPCANAPEGVYSWGDIGIGSCISGPTDLRFVEQDGRTLLLVSNADPYRNFQSGSVLAIDYDAVDLTTSRNLVHQLPTWSLPISDDDNGDDRSDTAMLGQIGVLPGGRIIVPGRHTEEGVAQPSANGQLRAGRDELYVLDIDPIDILPQQTPRILELRDDPYTVSVSPSTGLAYVGNLTDHSLSVLSTDGEVSLVDVAETAAIRDRRFVDAPSVGDAATTAELIQTLILRAEDLPDDQFTLTYAEGTQRIYRPELDGVVRYAGSAGTLTEATTGPDFAAIQSGAVAFDPFLYEVEGVPVALYTEAVFDDNGVVNGSIRRAVNGGTAASWEVEGVPLMIGSTTGPDRILGGPSVTGIEGLETLFYDGRASDAEPACIYVTVAEDGVTFLAAGRALIGGAACPDADIPTAFDEVAQPFVRFDPVANAYRMWMSVREGARWSIALSESEDGLRWTEPRVVYEEAASVGGPTVIFETDRYRMTASRQQAGGEGWDLVQSTSVDGVTWSAARLVVDAASGDEALPVTERPVRAGALFTPTSSWRVEGRDFGLVDARAFSGTGSIIVLPGFAFAVASGHEVSNAVVPSGWARQGLEPGAVVDIDGVPTLYATATSSAGRTHVVALQQFGDAWLTVEPFDAIDDALAPPGASTTDPVVVADAEGFVMFYGLTQGGRTRIRRATSPDGLSWVPEPRDLVPSGEESGWDVNQLPHSVAVNGEEVTLWYAGDDTSRFRIGAATAPGLREAFTAAPGEFDPWRFGPGVAGSFDDSGVKDPLVVDLDGVTHLYYSGFDGDAWHLGHAVQAGEPQTDGEFQRRIGEDELSRPSHSGLPATFSAQGVEGPVLLRDDGDALELLLSGFDGFARRMGAGRVLVDSPQVVYPNQRRATAGDALSFTTERGGDGVSVIELAQTVDEFVTDGIGMSDILIDEARGVMFVASKLSSGIIVVDLRDDSAGSFVDSNVFDIETVIRPLGGSAAMGFRGLAISEDRGLLYATATTPDGLWVIDLDTIEDNAVKEDLYAAPVAVLPLPSADRDAGERSQARIGGAGMAFAGEQGELLLVTHFRDNSLLVFDVDRDVVGEQVAYIPFLGENPHVVRVAPDGLTAVVANFTGDVVDKRTSSTLAVIDLDAASDTYLEPLTWIVNR